MQEIAAAALAVIERDGLPALSMRTVAATLGVGAMSLYRYVDSREELEREVVALVFGRIDARVPARSSWRRRITVLLERARAGMQEHPSIIPLLVTRAGTSPGLMQWAEAMLVALADGGFAGKERAIAFRTLLAFAIGAVQYEHFGPVAQRVDALPDVSPDDYPVLADTLSRAASISGEDVFRRGLRAVLRGLEVDFL
jgi:AcrR family transcriptional regulator